MALADLASQVVVDQKPVCRQARVQAVAGGGVEDVKDVLAKEWLTAGEGEAKTAETGELGEEAFHFRDRQGALVRPHPQHVLHTAPQSLYATRHVTRVRPPAALARPALRSLHFGERRPC